MNLKAYTASNTERPLFGSLCKNKAEARRYILNHGMLACVDYVIYKNKRYSIGEVYKKW